ncbi:hypothetical protein [Brevundimonas balnearis]|uniref:Uncharacterized protein n=1 Tax=Brevundimonas balnearis TaxID=1572858 RepID=A0ABV6R047_9CAUL
MVQLLDVPNEDVPNERETRGAGSTTVERAGAEIDGAAARLSAAGFDEEFNPVK